jgi:hypothetical protein
MKVKYGLVLSVLACLVLLSSPLAVAVTDTNVVTINCSITAVIAVADPGTPITIAGFGTAYSTTANYTLITAGGATLTAVVQSTTGVHTAHTFTIESTTTPVGTGGGQKTLINSGTNQAAQQVVSAITSGSFTGGVFTYKSTLGNGGVVAAKTVTVLYTLSA